MDKLNNKEEFNLQELYKQIEEAYNVSVVAEHFCNDFQEIEEIGNITPLVKLLHKKLNNAFTQLINARVYEFKKSM